MKKYLCMLLTLVLTLTVFTGCSEKEKEEEKKEETKKEITVTFMQGEEKLGEVKGYAGEKLTGYEEFSHVPDTEFIGWYETPTFIEPSKKDLTKDTFEDSTTLYGSFKSTLITEDTRLWYVVGTGTCPQLKDSNWAAATADDTVKDACQLKPTGANPNEFAITLNLYTGDQFQVIHDWAWDGQRGHGWFTQIDDTQMEGGGGLSDNTKKSNVNVLVDGNYTITLTTNPDNEALDTLTIVRNGDVNE